MTDSIAYPPRGLSRLESARYVGIGTTLFDAMVTDGRMPKPRNAADSDGEEMSETRLKYIISDVDRNGNRRWYLRRPGDRKIRLPGGPKSPDFIEHYVKAMEGYTAKPRAPRGASKRPQPRASRAMSGYIYFLKVGESVKIGFSKNPVKRWDELRTGMLKPCDTFVAIRGSERDERRLHWLLKSSRQHLEWFRATNTVITIMARAARHGVIMTDELGLEESVPLRSHFDGDNSVGLAEEISGGNQ